MNEFRAALERFCAAAIGFAELEQRLREALQQQPHMAPAISAMIDLYFHSGRLPEAPRGLLLEVVRGFVPAPRTTTPPDVPAPTAEEQRTLLRGPVATPTPAPEPPSPAAPAADRTVLRPPPPGSDSPSGATILTQPSWGDKPSSGVTGGEPSVRTGTPTSSQTGNFTGGFTGGATGGFTGGRVTGTGSSSATGQSRSSSWSDFAPGTGERLVSFDVGSVIRDRFVLEQVLGRGGMGIVFRARDTLQEEMQDRNPYVAIKVLNEDFRKHPESLKALQREARKAQNLAHPNIATVFNFDRDQGNVFVVMEMLEGESLDKTIKRSEGGLPTTEALRIVDGLGRALAYAHERGVIHSDFKPANAFLTREGVVKVFDFGIARAARRGSHGSGDKTMFDPGTLGALTPGYASCEMHEGGEPDPRDDVYALACVAYELLTGSHPFLRDGRKQSAVEARDAGLVPKPVKGLSTRQWRGLKRGLAFARNDRTPSIERFLEDVRPLKLPVKTLVAGSVGAVLLVVLLGIFARDMLNARSDRALRQVLETGDYAALTAAIEDLAGLDDVERRNRVLTDAARERLVTVYSERARQSFDPREGRFDYLDAQRLLEELRPYAGTTSSFERMERAIAENRGQAEKALGERIDEYLVKSWLIPQQNAANLVEALDALRVLNADSDRLKSQDQVRGYGVAFAESARRALDAGDAAMAGQLVDAGGKLLAALGVTANAELDGLRAQIAERGKRAELERTLAQLRESIRQLGASPGLDDVAARRGDIENLLELAPEAEARAVRELVDGALRARLDELERAGDFDAAQKLLDAYARTGSPEFTAQRQTRLASAQQDRQLIQQKVAAIEQRIVGLVAKPDLASERWERDLQNEFAALASYRAPGSDAFVEDKRVAVAGLYLAGAREQRGRGRLVEAQQYIEKAATYGPTLPDIEAERRALQQAAERQQQDKLRQQQEAQVARLKSSFREQAQAYAFDRADASLTELRKLLPASDAFLVGEVPGILAVAYGSRAEKRSIEGNFRQAVAVADLGLNRLRELQASPQARRPLEDDRKVYERLERLQQRLNAPGTLDVAGLRADLDQLRAGKHRALRDWERVLVATTEARLQRAYQQGPAQGDATLKQAKEIFRDKDAEKRLDAVRTAAVESSKSKATAERTGQTTEPGPAGGVAQMRARADVPAGGAARDGPAATPGSSVQGSPSAGETGAGPTIDPLAKAPAVATQPAPSPASPGAGPSTMPETCRENLAGRGKDRRASCTDKLPSGDGPQLVVVPSGGPGGAAFAISKYEISEADYARYCSATGACQATASANPKTSISASDAERYAKWLSDVTGRGYRLPTDAEWLYAAKAAGASGPVDYNCRSATGGTGDKLQSTRLGNPNAWGLVNVGGNADELVRSGGGWTARGGAYSDPINECGPDASRVHLGQADPKTGFRVVRELKK